MTEHRELSSKSFQILGHQGERKMGCVPIFKMLSQHGVILTLERSEGEESIEILRRFAPQNDRSVC